MYSRHQRIDITIKSNGFNLDWCVFLHWYVFVPKNQGDSGNQSPLDTNAAQ